jgi:hypothetical protein
MKTCYFITIIEIRIQIEKLNKVLYCIAKSSSNPESGVVAYVCNPSYWGGGDREDNS